MQGLVYLRKILAEVEEVEDSSLPLTNQLIEIRPHIENYLVSVKNLPYTIHDWRHSEKVEQLCTELIPHSFLKQLSTKNLFILTLGLWLHDGGMVPDSEGQSDNDIRENHHHCIARRIRNKEKELKFIASLNSLMCEALAILCKSHCLPTIHDIPETFSIGNDTIKLQLLSAILRLCDISDVCSDRTPGIIYKNFIFRQESKRHWDTHRLIDGFSATHDKNETIFNLQARFQREKEFQYINEIIKYIEIEFYKSKDIFSKSGWQISSKIKSNIYEKDPEDDKTITVLPQNVYALLFENIYESNNVYIRELIQNTIDSIKIKKKLSEKNNMHYDAKIQVTLFYKKNEKEKKIPHIIKISDNGVGMNKADVNDFLLDIGKGIAQSQEIDEILNSGKHPEKLIAEFGIGFLTCFPVSNRIIMKTKKEGFFGLKLEFPDYSENYNTISEKQVKIRKENISDTGTTILLYLNSRGKKIPVFETLQYFCRNISYSLIYQEIQILDEIDLWDSHQHSKNCQIIEKRFLGENAEEENKLILSIKDNKYFEGVIAFFPKDRTNEFYISQEGIFIENYKHIIPDFLLGIKGEINLKAKVIDLTASRTHIKTNEKFDKLRTQLLSYFNLLIEKIISANSIKMDDDYGIRSNQFITALNHIYEFHKNKKDELLRFYESIENYVNVFYGPEKKIYSLYNIRIILEKENKSKLYHLIEHKYYYSHYWAGKIDGYDIGLFPNMNQIKGKQLFDRGEIFFTTLHCHKSPTVPESIYRETYLERAFFNSYFELLGYEVIQSQPDSMNEFIIGPQKKELEYVKIVKNILNNDNQSFISNESSMRFLYQFKSYINISHQNVKSIIGKYEAFKRKNQINEYEETLLAIYFQLVAFNITKSIENTEELLFKIFESKEKK